MRSSPSAALSSSTSVFAPGVTLSFDARLSYFFFSSRRRHTRLTCDWSSDVCSSDLNSLTATSDGLTGNPVTFAAMGTAGAATQIALNAGNAQAATVGTAVATPPSVIVRDQFANPVPGVAVTFATSGDNGTVDPATAVTTNANGVAAANSWTLGTAAKLDTLRATAAGLSSSPVTFTATATAGGPSATQSTVAAAPATITAGAGSSTITVTVRDANGNPVSGATVTLAVSPATGSTLTQPVGTTSAGG